MKSLHLDTEPTWRGGEQQLLYLLEGLAARRHTVTLLAQPGSPLLERARAAGIDVCAFSVRGEADLAAAWRLARRLRNARFDVLHCHTSHAHSVAIAARWFAPPAARPQLVVARRVDFHVRRGRLFDFSLWKYRRPDRIVAVSEAVKAILAGDGVPTEKISVVRDGVDVARVERAPERTREVRHLFGLREGERLVVNVAHLTPHKGQRYLVAALPAIRAARPDARVVIVGEGALRADLEAQARSLGLGEGLVFAGFRPPDELPSILKAADAFVFPSVEEGLGSALFESMAAGAPIVASRAGGIPEIVTDGETGLLVPPRDPAALARAVVRLLEDTALARGLATAARGFVRAAGTRERMVEETIRVYEELLRR